MKIALFGGSFNPIHNGHINIADELINQKIVDEVWFIPCGNHAFNKELSDGETRINLINLAIENNPKFKIIDLELMSKEKSYTSETIKILKNFFPSHKFYFIIGADNLENLGKWHNIEYLEKNIEFILINRPGFGLLKNSKIKIKYRLDLKHKTSSSLIRENLKKGISIKKLLPEKVEHYIKQERLYCG
ncbi:MAG: nicotinate (nicotinamide) nucleotide adenylyltransferase [Nanoarchaeota archaeon]